MFHYVYRIKNLELNMHYYGVRSSKIEPQEDIGIFYFSSSSNKDFLFEQKLFPEKFKYKIVKIFENRTDAVEFEIKLHNKFNVGVNEMFYNRSKQTSVGWDMTGTRASEESKMKMSESSKGENHPNFGKRGEGTTNFGKTHSDKTKAKMGEDRTGEKNAMYGKTHSDESKSKMSAAQKVKQRFHCIYCNGFYTQSNITRWHNEMCKFKDRRESCDDHDPMR